MSIRFPLSPSARRKVEVAKEIAYNPRVVALMTLYGTGAVVGQEGLLEQGGAVVALVGAATLTRQAVNHVRGKLSSRAETVEQAWGSVHEPSKEPANEAANEAEKPVEPRDPRIIYTTSTRGSDDALQIRHRVDPATREALERLASGGE